MRYSVWVSGLLLVLGWGKGAWADPPAGDAPKTLPQDGFFSSLKQALKQGYDQEVVRGHFEVGTAPNVHRYYCLMDAKTGVREPNGVLGDLVPLDGGMTGIKNGSVSLYTCATAEQQGMLVTAGYNVGTAHAAAPAQAQTPAQGQTAAQGQIPAAATSSAMNAASAPNSATAQNSAPAPVSTSPPISAQPAIPAPAPIAAASPNRVAVSPQMIDIGGVKLGMSPDEVRAVLKPKKLLHYTESPETLGYLDSAKGLMQSVPNGRFVNVIASWTPPPSSGADPFEGDGESYQVMFTPIPGRERVVAIVHSVGYSPANAIRETDLESALVRKYGGFARSADLPQSPTWRVQSDGSVQVGDPCNRRGTFGGLAGLSVPTAARENPVLKGTPEDFQSQIDHCGVAIVTEDHFTANGGALREDRLVTRFTVTAYSPSLSFEDAKAAAQLIQAAGGSAKKPNVSRAKDLPASSL